MKTKLIQGFIVSTMLLSSISFAASQSIPCPSVDLIQKSISEVNTVSEMGGKYITWSLNWAFTYSNYHWHVMSYLDANDFNSAYELGKNNIRNATKQRDKTASEVQGAYICSYTGSRDLVAALAFKAENSPFKVASVDFASLHLNG